MKYFLNACAFAALSVVAAASLQAQTVQVNSGNSFAAIDPASSRQADASFIGGYGRLDFSAGDQYDGVRARTLGGAVGALNVINGGESPQAPQGILGASVVTHTVTNGSRAPVVDAISWQSPAVNTLTVQSTGANAGQMLELGLKGGLSLSSKSVPGNATGGVVEMSNIRVDLNNGRIVADLSGTRHAVNALGSPDYLPAESFSSLATAVWTFGSVDGPTRLNPATIAGVNPAASLQADGFTVVETFVSPPTTFASTVFRSDMTLNDLMLTPEASVFLSDAWGLQSTGQAAIDAVHPSSAGGWGDMRVGAFFQTGFINTNMPASIPEPSTYMLMGLGLIGVWGVSRQSARRRQST